jgi:predicted glycosyltransferase
MPYFTAPERGLKAMLEVCCRYDKILVHSPEDADLPYMAKAVSLEKRISPKVFLSVFKELRGKIVFTGYLLPRKPGGRKIKTENFVLVTRGGGSTSDRFFEAAIGAASIMDIPFLLVAGPATPPGRLARFRRLAAAGGGKAEVIASSPELPGLMARAAVCVSTAGGSAYEMLALRKKMVLAPFCGAKGREHSDQLARAWLMRDLAGAAVLLPADLTSGKIAAAISERLARPLKISKRVKPGWFRGAERAAAVLS